MQWLLTVLVCARLLAGLSAAECPAKCACVDHAIDCRARSLAQVPTDDIGPDATSWDLSHNNLTELGQHAFHIERRFSHHINIDLSFNQIANVSDMAFSHMENVRSINLSFNNINHIDFKHMKSNNMYALYLSNNTRLHLPNHFFDIPRLKVLALDGCGLSRIPSHFFEGAARLRTLDLANNKLSHLDNDVFSHLKGLYSLDLRGNAFTTVPSVALKHLGRHVSIELDNNPFVCDCMEHNHAYVSDLENAGHKRLYCTQAWQDNFYSFLFPDFYENHCQKHHEDFSTARSVQAIVSKPVSDGSHTTHYGAVVAGTLSAMLVVAVVVIVAIKVRRNAGLRDSNSTLQRFSILSGSEEI